MVSKRPFHGEESYEIGCKHPRQQEHTAQQSLIVGIARCNTSPQKFFSDEGENSARKSQDEKVAREIVSEDLNGANKELEINPSGGISSYWWVNGNNIHEYAGAEAAVHFPFFPHYFELDHRVTALVQPRDIYSVLLDHPPRKLVSVGPDHQADVPEWAPKGFSKSSGGLDESDAHVDDDENGVKLVGTCVIPTPDMELPGYSCCGNEGTRNFCNCLDMGSIRCVRQHVMEAREALRENLGQKIFEELGFCDMGEEVAKKWNEEEEQTFHEVVLSNAASEGKNFWDHLPAIFPSRTKKDLVSYYFNVYMLRKRAKQNRFEPLNIDSDNDEWQGSELGMADEDDDSAVESLDQEFPGHNQENREEEFLEGIEEIETDTCKDDVNPVNHSFVMGEEDERGNIDDVSAAHVGNFYGGCGFDPLLELSGKISSNNVEDQENQDDSCTSFESQSDKVDSHGPVDPRTDAGVQIRMTTADNCRP